MVGKQTWPPRRPDQAVPARAGRGGRVGRWMVAAWLAVGALALTEVRLPDVAAVRPPTVRAASGGPCWGVAVYSAPAAEPSLHRNLRRLRSAGLRATVLPAAQSGVRILVVPARSKQAAGAARARTQRLGFDRARVRRLPPRACRS